MNNDYEGCIRCSNFQKFEILGQKTNVCMANINYPKKCILYKPIKTDDEFGNRLIRKYGSEKE